MKVSSIYEDVKADVNAEENGVLTFDHFNRFSRRGENRLLDFITGDVEDENVPAAYLSQKNKDWVSFLIKPKDAQVEDGFLERPSDYYLFDNLKKLELKGQCEGEKGKIVTTPIELLDGPKFNQRQRTYIEELSVDNKPISKLTTKEGKIYFEFAPKEIGSVVLEYIRYPKYAFLASKKDDEFNDLIPDDAHSDDYEWGEYAREILVWFIVDSFCNRNRDQSLKQFNNDTSKLVREKK